MFAPGWGAGRYVREDDRPRDGEVRYGELGEVENRHHKLRGENFGHRDGGSGATELAAGVHRLRRSPELSVGSGLVGATRLGHHGFLGPHLHRSWATDMGLAEDCAHARSNRCDQQRCACQDSGGEFSHCGSIPS